MGPDAAHRALGFQSQIKKIGVAKHQALRRVQVRPYLFSHESAKLPSEMATLKKWWKPGLAIILVIVALQVAVSLMARTHRVLAYLVSVTGYGLIAGDEVVPEENRVPFEEAIQAWGLLLERGVAPPRAGNRKAARSLLVSMVEKMQAGLRDLDKPSADLDKPSSEKSRLHENHWFVTKWKRQKF